MTQEKYQELLLDDNWIQKSIFIKNRDNNKCTKCNSTVNLHVHHTYYQSGAMPWEYPDSSLITLCGICHKNEHLYNKIPVKYKKRTFEEKLLDYPPYIRESILRFREKKEKKQK